MIQILYYYQKNKSEYKFITKKQNAKKWENRKNLKILKQFN